MIRLKDYFVWGESPESSVGITLADVERCLGVDICYGETAWEGWHLVYLWIRTVVG